MASSLPRRLEPPLLPLCACGTAEPGWAGGDPVEVCVTSRKVIYYFCFDQKEATECFLLVLIVLDCYMVICYPLKYLFIWFNCSVIFASVVPLYFTILLLCGPYVLDYLVCELPILLHMLCTDIFLQKTMMVIGRAKTLLFPFLLIIPSYLHFLVAMMKIQSSKRNQQQQKISTCTSLLTVMTIYYGTGWIGNMKPKSLYSVEGDKLILFYLVINPMLNPFIYSLRNKEMKVVLWRLLSRNNNYI
ncbi:LOW QUALITY PROTEIN: olfactory receptor 2A12-like [Panthera uncia]|uniref:LOW QUALITY PROTEIN: olfactory receptor 2A12-like n=1 Tax=Panthera uncia TaxID=29064 RepID=UPI0020FF8E7E|nr:LOW QUALITY PROTEIN: olfactory receptor 2A12-like [Panthera uncia]